MLAALISLVLFALRAVELAVLGTVIATWLDIDPDNPILRVLRAVADPLLRLVRPLARRIPGPVDWSPLVVLLGLHLLRTLLLGVG
jgi:YggT family protein